MSEVDSVIMEPEQPQKAAKPANKRKIIILVTVLAVLAVAGAGFWVWHQTPEFCNAICHTPQDAYNPTYYAEPGQAATDKWGNDVADARGMLAATHRVEADANCLSCHEPTMAEQISEGIEWVTGNFYAPLSERSLTDLVRWHDDMDATEFCLRDGCHEMTKEDLTEKTKFMPRNPHSWHHTEYTCNDCHKSHRASVMVCSQCHDDAVVVRGWITWEQSQNLETTYLSYEQEQFLYGEE